MRVGQTRRRDSNEREIIDALRDIGVTVKPLSSPGVHDLLCWTKWEWYRLIEVKTATGTRTPAQDASDLPRCEVRSVAEALALYGVR